MEDMRIYVASLSDYNNGRLEGKWLDLSDYSDASELMEAIQEMLDELTEKYKSIDGEVREEWAVHDYEGIPSTLASEYMGEQDFQQLYDIAEVAEDRGIPVEVLVERAGDTGSDDYQALADSLMFVVDGNDESDIVHEYESQLGELGSDFWSNHIYVDDVTERVMYGEDVDRIREDILYENPDMDEDEAERQAEELADEEAERRADLTTYLEDMGYGDEIPSWVSKDYEGAWKRSLSYDLDVIHHDGEMYVFSNNYGVGGTILSGLVGAYIGYKIGRARPQKIGFGTEIRIGNSVKDSIKNKIAKRRASKKKKYATGGGVSSVKYDNGGEIYDDTNTPVSDSLKKKLRKKLGLKPNDDLDSSDSQVYWLSYSDNDAGSLFDKVMIDYLEKKYPQDIVVEKSKNNGKDAFIFGDTADRYIEAVEDFGGRSFDDWAIDDDYFEILKEMELKAFNKYLDDLEAQEHIFDREEVLDWLMDMKGMGYYEPYPNRIEIDRSELNEDLEAEGLVKFTYATGGGIGFKGLSAKVAKRYEGKKPEAKYRGEYGKRYSKSEAKEVGDKVAGKVYWQQRGRKFEDGGRVGQEIVFDDNGEENTGVIKEIHEITGDYIVNSDDGRTLLAQRDRDVISLGKMRKERTEAPRKRFGFFEGGGAVDKHKVFVAQEDGILGIYSGSDAYSVGIKKGDKFETIANQQDDINWWFVKKIDKNATKMYENSWDYNNPNKVVNVDWEKIVLVFPKGDKGIYAEMKEVYAQGGGVSGLDDLIRG